VAVSARLFVCVRGPLACWGPGSVGCGRRAVAAEMEAEEVVARLEARIMALEQQVLDLQIALHEVERGASRPPPAAPLELPKKWTVSDATPNLSEYFSFRKRRRAFARGRCRMKFVRSDLVQADEEWLAHLVSGELHRGKGIAKDLADEFGPVPDALPQYAIGTVVPQKKGGRTLLNLVSKDRYFHRLSYNPEQHLANFRRAIEGARDFCKKWDIKRLALCRLGARLERIHWRYTHQLLLDVFSELDIELVVYFRRSEMAVGVQASGAVSETPLRPLDSARVNTRRRRRARTSPQGSPGRQGANGAGSRRAEGEGARSAGPVLARGPETPGLPAGLVASAARLSASSQPTLQDTGTFDSGAGDCPVVRPAVESALSSTQPRRRSVPCPTELLADVREEMAAAVAAHTDAGLHRAKGLGACGGQVQAWGPGAAMPSARSCPEAASAADDGSWAPSRPHLTPTGKQMAQILPPSRLFPISTERCADPADGSLTFVASSVLSAASEREEKDESVRQVDETVGGAAPQNDLLVFSPNAESASHLN